MWMVRFYNQRFLVVSGVRFSFSLLRDQCDGGVRADFRFAGCALVLTI
jgi:hypothetical protein